MTYVIEIVSAIWPFLAIALCIGGVAGWFAAVEA